MLPATIQNMPEEILHFILELVPLPSLLACTLVAKSFYKVIKTSSRLQYWIHLSKARLIEVPLPSSLHHLSYATRLALHQRRERAWRTLTYASRHALGLQRGSVYELKNNIYAHGKENEAGLTSSITFYDLPHAPYSRPISDQIPQSNAAPELRNWTHVIHDLQIRDFTVDPSQDLLVLVTTPPATAISRFEIHLRTLSGNVAHPCAVSPLLPCLPRLNPILNVALGQAQLHGTAAQTLQGLIHNLNHLFAQVPPATPQTVPSPQATTVEQPTEPPRNEANQAGPTSSPSTDAGPSNLPPPPPPPPPGFFQPNGLIGWAGGSMGAVRVQLLGNIVALMVQMSIGGTHLVIWDWKKGETVPGCALTVLGGIDDFTLVSSSAFLAVTSTGTFELYKFELSPVSDASSAAPSLFIGPLPYFKARDLPVPEHLLVWKVRFPLLVARYSLPPLNLGHSFSSLALSSNPVMDTPLGNPDDSLTFEGVRSDVKTQPSLRVSEESGSPSNVQPVGNQNDDAAPASSLPIDMKMTYPSPRSRVFACGLFVLKHEPFTIPPPIDPLPQMTNPPFPVNPPPGLAAALAAIATVHPAQAGQPEDEEDEEDVEPLLRSFVFFSDLGMFLRDLDRFEKEAPQDSAPSEVTPISDSIPDDLVFDVTMPYDLLLKTPRFTTPIESLPDDSPEKIGRITRDRIRRHFRTRITASWPKELSWNDWGPKNTRWFNEHQSQDWQHAVHGMRTLESVERINGNLINGQRRPRRYFSPLLDETATPGAADEVFGGGGYSYFLNTRYPKALVLRDFNPYSCANPSFYLSEPSSHGGDVGTGKSRERAPDASPVRWRQPTIVTEPSILDTSGAFKENITSSLPYTEVVSEEDFDANSVMLDDEHILLLQRDQNSHVSGLDILTF